MSTLDRDISAALSELYAIIFLFHFDLRTRDGQISHAATYFVLGLEGGGTVCTIELVIDSKVTIVRQPQPSVLRFALMPFKLKKMIFRSMLKPMLILTWHRDHGNSLPTSSSGVHWYIVFNAVRVALATA